jgi:hypothetical protein
MSVKIKAVGGFFAAGIMLLVLWTGPALSQQELKGANELNQKVVKLHETGKYAEAIPLARRAIVLREQALGATHPDVSESLNNLAVLLQATGDYAEARPPNGLSP